MLALTNTLRHLQVFISLLSINLLFAVSLFAQDDGRPPSTRPGPDLVEQLKMQIETAANSEEKTHLQMKLVEMLIPLDKQAALEQLHSMADEGRFDPQTFYNIGNALARLGDSEAAVGAYRKAIAQRNGNYSRALNNLGVVLMRQGLWAQASDALTSALRLESFRYAEASYNLGRLYAAQGQMDLATREWRRTLSIDPRHTAAAQAIDGAGSEGRITVASAAKIEKLKTERPVTSAGTPLNRPSGPAKTLTVDQQTFNQLQEARAAHEQGKDEESIRRYRSVISRMGGYFGPANLELSYVLISLKQTNEAVINLQAVTARDGGRFPISYYHLGRLYEMNGDLVSAAEAYSQAANYFHNTNRQFLLDISRVCEKRSDFKGALAALEQYLSAIETMRSRPAWSEEKLSQLRQRIKESESKKSVN